MITGIILTRNSEMLIARAITCLRKFDEVLVYDTGSVDKTVEIANMFGVKVITDLFQVGFSTMKNRAIAAAANPQVFILDSDEVINENVYDEIDWLLGRKPEKCIAFRRVNMYDLKKYVKEWYPDVQRRAFNRQYYKYEREVHEVINVDQDKVIQAETLILHNLHYDSKRLSLNLRTYKQIEGVAVSKVDADKEVESYKNKPTEILQHIERWEK